MLVLAALSCCLSTLCLDSPINLYSSGSRPLTPQACFLDNLFQYRPFSSLPPSHASFLWITTDRLHAQQRTLSPQCACTNELSGPLMGQERTHPRQSRSVTLTNWALAENSSICPRGVQRSRLPEHAMSRISRHCIYNITSQLHDASCDMLWLFFQFLFSHTEMCVCLFKKVFGFFCTIAASPYFTFKVQSRMFCIINNGLSMYFNRSVTIHHNIEKSYNMYKQ